MVLKKGRTVRVGPPISNATREALARATAAQPEPPKQRRDILVSSNVTPDQCSDDQLARRLRLKRGELVAAEGNEHDIASITATMREINGFLCGRMRTDHPWHRTPNALLNALHGITRGAGRSVQGFFGSLAKPQQIVSSGCIRVDEIGYTTGPMALSEHEVGWFNGGTLILAWDVFEHRNAIRQLRAVDVDGYGVQGLILDRVLRVPITSDYRFQTEYPTRSAVDAERHALRIFSRVSNAPQDQHTVWGPAGGAAIDLIAELNAVHGFTAYV